MRIMRMLSVEVRQSLQRMSSQVRTPFPRLQISCLRNVQITAFTNNNHLKPSPSNLQLRDHDAFHVLQTGILALEGSENVSIVDSPKPKTRRPVVCGICDPWTHAQLQQSSCIRSDWKFPAGSEENNLCFYVPSYTSTLQKCQILWGLSTISTHIYNMLPSFPPVYQIFAAFMDNSHIQPPLNLRIFAGALATSAPLWRRSTSYHGARTGPSVWLDSTLDAVISTATQLL